MTAGTSLTSDDLSHLQDVAVEAARVGAGIVRRHFPDVHRADDRERKAAGDYVTAVDRDSEDAIREHLTRAAPDIPILAEESGGDEADLLWVVDPLDGTTNFLIGLPVVGVNVALVERRRPVVGVTIAPMLGMELRAARGHGAYAGDTRLRVSARASDTAIVTTGHPFRRKSLMPRYLRAFERILRSAEDLRRPGAASLDLSWVASGVFDGFFELNLGMWDVSAGGLLVEEAGGVVTDWRGTPDYLSGNILAASPQTHEMLLRIALETEDEPGS